MGMYKGIIYCAISPNGKRYIGLSTKSLNQRKSQHFSIFKKSPRNLYFYNALRKYGFDNFEWILLEEIEADSKIDLLKDLKILESFYISKYNTSKKEFGYNLTLGGDEGPNEDTIEKIKKINTEKWTDPEYRKKQEENWEDAEFVEKFKNIMKGLSNENSRKIKEKWTDPEYRAKLVNIRNTDEYKQNQRNNALKQWEDPEIREKSLKSFKEKIWNNPERNKKISDALKRNAIEKRKKEKEV